MTNLGHVVCQCFSLRSRILRWRLDRSRDMFAFRKCVSVRIFTVKPCFSLKSVPVSCYAEANPQWTGSFPRLSMCRWIKSKTNRFQLSSVHRSAVKPTSELTPKKCKMTLKYPFKLIVVKCIFEFFINTAPQASNSSYGREKCLNCNNLRY